MDLSWRNATAPINRLPADVLLLLPDFWDTHERNQKIIALTHVCRAWRQIFTSRSSLWVDIDCEDADKTRVYLERSRSSPIILSLCRRDNLPPDDSFFQITPHVIERLESLFVNGTPENLQEITNSLSCPAPLLEDMAIIGGHRPWPEDDIPDLTPALFDGDLSSLCELRLKCVRTELPWRNMAALTSFTLVGTSPVSVGHLLDFLESAPRLQDVELCFEISTSGAAEDGRLVSLAHLRFMSIKDGSSSVLLDHLLIPVGADLTVLVDLPRPTTEHPRFLDNLRNLSDFTAIKLNSGYRPQIEFRGPNGKVTMALTTEAALGRGTCLTLGFLAQFDTSKTEWLRIDFSGLPPSHPHHTILPMKNLRTLELHQCETPHDFIHALDPSKSPSGFMLCPKLEALVIISEATFVKDVVGMAAARKVGGGRHSTLLGSLAGGGGPNVCYLMRWNSRVTSLIWNGVMDGGNNEEAWRNRWDIGTPEQQISPSVVR